MKDKLMEAKVTHSLALVASRVYELLFSLSRIPFPEQIWLTWWWIRKMLIVPMMNIVVICCLIMSTIVIIEKVFMGSVSLYAKIFRRRPEKIYKCDPIVGDEETGNLAFPMVLVQIPMYNEKEVYQLSIGAACNISWPTDRMIIQVLDDSTDPIIKDLVQSECEKWRTKGKNIRYETRNNRNGYKAGALKEGMKYDYVQTCEYVAMFDADFQPAHSFLIRTVPFLVHNPDVALVQARWTFVNSRECLMTRMQEMGMDYHFKVEQESGSSTFRFFGFNGTAGIWRIQAINEAGGWHDRTTVEDMDLAVRAGLKGWKFVYVGNIKVNSELPSTFKAYRYQQHRWSCGPAKLFKKMIWDIICAEKASPLKKFYMLYNFFLARKVISHVVAFFFYCVVVPSSVFFPEVTIPQWGMIYIPVSITLMNCICTPRSIHLVIFWVLFENVMSLHRSKAVLIGLLESGRADEWVVTEKLGDLLKSNPSARIAKRFQSKFWERFHILELTVGVYLMLCACYNYFCRDDYMFVFILPQAITFFVMGFGYIGTIIPSNK